MIANYIIRGKRKEEDNEIWPTLLQVIPCRGDYVQSLSGQQAMVLAIIHKNILFDNGECVHGLDIYITTSNGITEA